MTRQRLCGYDLSGWLDSAARNWIVEPGGGIVEAATVVSRTDPSPSVVRAGSNETERWVGGVQADLAPHGRGGGWGDVGKDHLRRQVRDLLKDPTAEIPALAAAMTGLVQGASCAVVSVDDSPESTEALRERLLAAVSMTGARRSMLVWRPVLAALWAIEEDVVQDEQKVGVICHSSSGFLLQTLAIRRSPGRQADFLTPERKRAGKLLASAMGYAPLTQRAQESQRDDRLSLGQMAVQTAFGFPAQAEILRAPNGDWVKRVPISAPALPDSDVSPDGLSLLSDCDLILFETLVQGELRAEIATRLADALPGKLLPLPADGIARGALAAAARLASGDPVHFDFLPRIATIVSGAEGPQSFDLINPDETLPAGKPYRSPTPARLALAAGQARISVYLYKEDQPHPRVARLDLGAPVDRMTPVEVSVEQSPAAGRARILLSMPDLGRHLSVDWETAEELQKPWPDVIADLQGPAPTVPKRLVLRCSAIHWHNGEQSIGLANLLMFSVSQRNLDWKTLASRMAQRMENAYPISSDGELPEGISTETREFLSTMNARAEADVLHQLNSSAIAETGSLKFLTWQFRHCPVAIAERLLDVVETPGAMERLFPHHSTKKLIYQGLGRILSTEAQELRMMAHLLDKPVEAWDWQRETACMAFLLSRSDTAPKILERDDVNVLLRRIEIELGAYEGPEDTKIRYAVILLVGLLRWRLKEPYALVAGRDPSVGKTLDLLQDIVRDLARKRNPRPWQLRQYQLLQQTEDELRGEGSNPELLLDLFSIGTGDKSQLD